MVAAFLVAAGSSGVEINIYELKYTTPDVLFNMYWVHRAAVILSCQLYLSWRHGMTLSTTTSFGTVH